MRLFKMGSLSRKSRQRIRRRARDEQAERMEALYEFLTQYVDVELEDLEIPSRNQFHSQYLIEVPSKQESYYVVSEKDAEIAARDLLESRILKWGESPESVLGDAPFEDFTDEDWDSVDYDPLISNYIHEAGLEYILSPFGESHESNGYLIFQAQ